MNNGSIGVARSRAGLMCSVGFALATQIVLPATASAQAASGTRPPAVASSSGIGSPTAEEPARDIVVTGTRVVRDGYQAPTPTTVLGAAEIAAKAPANLAEFVNQLPSLAATSTPKANTAFISAGLVGINALNLRNLGENRTLVLLDGQRVGGSTVSGLVDVNLFPQQLIKRVDVVTGGVSADYGSDAVAGVVNFILDKDFTGLKGEAQGGLTNYGDDGQYKLSLAAGTAFADGRGHLIVSAEHFHTNGIQGIGSRKWYDGAKIVANPNYTSTNGQPALLSTTNVGYLANYGGVVVTPGTLFGTTFGPGGVVTRGNIGTVSGINMIGGDWRTDDISADGDLDPKQSRQNAFGRVGFDVTDHFHIFAQGSYGRATSSNAILPYLGFQTAVAADNAFIPASIASQVTGPIRVSTFAGDLGFVNAYTKRTSWRGVLGANGDFNAVGSNWTWDAYYQRSVNKSLVTANSPISANFANAVDAVRGTNGVPICRSTLANPTNGCVPFNIFGTGVNGQSVTNYIMGNEFRRDRLVEDVASATLHGAPFSTWAGKVSLAAGVEHRREGVSGQVDALNATQAIPNTKPPYFVGNYRPTIGAYNVTEGFIEAVVPLARDVAFVHSLDLNGAVRETSYSTSGYVTTWKAGLTYQPISDITFRVVRSRDIRAPNLSELFTSALTSTTLVADPTRGGASVTTFTVQRGNLNLKPEIANSLGLGIVLQPSFLRGFAMSVDYYSIKIKGAISSVDAQTEVNQCAAGNAVFCSVITRDAGGNLTSVGVSPINFAKQISRGVDFEASYRRPAFGGNLGLRLVGTRFIKNYFDNGISPATDTVGTNGYNTVTKNTLPKWRYMATLSWAKDPVALSFTARGFSAGVQNTSYIECSASCPTSTATNQTINSNHLPGATYFDGNITFKLTHQIETYLAVDNILNKDPASVAYGPGLSVIPLNVNPVLYDVVGRTFRMGVRFKL